MRGLIYHINKLLGLILFWTIHLVWFKAGVKDDRLTYYTWLCYREWFFGRFPNDPTTRSPYQEAGAVTIPPLPCLASHKNFNTSGIIYRYGIYGDYIVPNKPHGIKKS